MERKLTISELIQEVGDWSKLNFAEKQAPVLGIVEELGEACRCILKNIQGIRGYDNEEKFQTDLQDAMADVMIYLCNFAYNHNAVFAFNRNELTVPQPIDRSADFVLSHILQVVASMFTQEYRFSTENAPEESGVYGLFCQRFCSAMAIWAAMYYIDLESATFGAWENVVRKRNWVVDSIEGGGHKHKL